MELLDRGSLLAMLKTLHLGLFKSTLANNRMSLQRLALPQSDRISNLRNIKYIWITSSILHHEGTCAAQ